MWDQSLSEIQLGHESAREAEQASSLSSDGLNQTTQGLERANRELERIQRQTALDLPRIRGNLKKKRAQELERFKTEINLVSYAQSQGYEYLQRESPRNSAVLRHNSGDKIVVATDPDGHGVYFSVRDDADKGTIIDFVQNRRNLSLTEVRKELRDWLQESKTRPSKFRPIAQPQPITRDRLAVIKAARLFKVAHSHPYLEKQGLERSILKTARFLGTVAIDEHDNAIFPHYDRDGLTGYSMKNSNFTGFSPGGTKALWQSNQQKNDTRLVITETAIDALSYHQLFSHENSKTRYIATGGTISPLQLELISTAMAEMTNLGGSIAIATDNDEMGNKMAKTLCDLATSKSKVERHVPQVGKNWHELGEQSRQRTLTRQKRQRSSGFEL